MNVEIMMRGLRDDLILTMVRLRENRIPVLIRHRDDDKRVWSSRTVTEIMKLEGDLPRDLRWSAIFVRERDYGMAVLMAPTILRMTER